MLLPSGRPWRRFWCILYVSIMRYGISAAAIIVHESRLLLVNHRFDDGLDFWLPPGGKLEGGESIFDCARREAFEETGLTVELDRILYIQEFVEPGYHFCKFFISARSFAGSLTRDHVAPDEHFLKEARFFSQKELADLDVGPDVLKERFWQDRAVGRLEMLYLGVEHVEG
jgi:8-oxo-dGTP diphosphatase